MKFLLTMCLFPYAIHASGTIANHVPSGAIDIYRAERDEKALLQIARDNMPALASTLTRKEPKRTQELERLLHTEVLSSFRNPQIHSKVYLHQSTTPVGFINYAIKHPWHLLRPRATIFHLAVDARYRRFGYGGLLLQHAIEHCKAKSVKNIELRTIGWHIGGSDLERFYTRFGFVSGYSDVFSYITPFKLRLK